MALNLAKNSECVQRHGAVVVKSGRIVARGVNKYRNNPSDFIDANGISVHAEVAAIRQCSAETLRGATVYVARYGRCKQPAMSKPCENCHKALVEAGVKKIIYTDSVTPELVAA